MTQYETYLHHYEKGSNNTHHHYYTNPPYRYSNIAPGQPSDPEPPSDSPPDPDRERQRWKRTVQSVANALGLSSEDGLTQPNPDRAQRNLARRKQRAQAGNALSMCSSDDDGLSATSSYVADHPYLNVNLEEREPRVYTYRSFELANPASTRRHATIPAGVRLRGGGRDEEPPWWFMCAASKAARRFSIDWAAWDADRSLREDLGFEGRETRRGRRKSRTERRDSSAASDALRPKVLEACNRAFELYAAAQKDRKSRDKQINADRMAAMFKQMLEDRRVREYYKATMTQQYHDNSDSSSMPDVAWLQWGKYGAQRRSAFERDSTVSEWERSETRQQADIKEYQKKIQEKNQQNEYIRLRGKEKAIVRRSKTKRATGLLSLLKMQKPKKMGKSEVNDAEWIDVPMYYEESGEWKWERRVRPLKN